MSIAIVAGGLANKPQNGGFAWVPLSYALGLRRLGFDVYLFEQIDAAACMDSWGRPAPFETSANRAFFLDVTGRFGFEGRSVLFGDDGLVAGLDASDFRNATSDAELLVNISGHATLDWILDGPRLSAYVDTDPGFTQMWNRGGLLDPSLWSHTHHFSVGCNFGHDSCLVPDDGIRWCPLPPPVVLDEWSVMRDTTSEMRFTTIATWRSPSGVISLDGNTYLPSKLHEFRRMLPLPSLVSGARFEIALDIQPADESDRQHLLDCGWLLVDPRDIAGDPGAFRIYVGASSAEFSTAQGVYSVARTGWISDRSVRYLASGRPVLVQDTGVSRAIANGEGMLTFTTLHEAQQGAKRIVANYQAHSAAARHLAETFFDSDRVLGDMLDRMGARA